MIDGGLQLHTSFTLALWCKLPHPTRLQGGSLLQAASDTGEPLPWLTVSSSQGDSPTLTLHAPWAARVRAARLEPTPARPTRKPPTASRHRQLLLGQAAKRAQDSRPGRREILGRKVSTVAEEAACMLTFRARLPR